jgi:hypothetical protein
MGYNMLESKFNNRTVKENEIFIDHLKKEQSSAKITLRLLSISEKEVPTRDLITRIIATFIEEPRAGTSTVGLHKLR